RWRLERLGLAGVTVTDEDADPLAHESQALAGLSEAAVLGWAALGRRAGRGPLRIGADPDAPWVERDDRPRLERLCQYLFRPPVEDLGADKAKPGRASPKYPAWAELMHRAFEADVLACPRCGGRMVVLATIEDPAVIRRILTHLGASMEPGEALPAARASPWT